MVTKLKNSRKFAAVLMILVVLLSALVMVGSYPSFPGTTEDTVAQEVKEETLRDLSDDLLQGVYYLYNEINETMTQSELRDAFEADDFLLLRKYMDYEVFDVDGKALIGKDNSQETRRLIKEETSYAFRVSFLVTEEGELKEVKVDGTVLDTREAYDLEESLIQDYRERGNEYIYELTDVSGIKAVFGMTSNSLDVYMEENGGSQYSYVVELSNTSNYLMYEWALIIFVGVAAILITLNKAWRVHEWKLFHAPFELVWIVWCYLLAHEQNIAGVVWNTFTHEPGYIISSTERAFTNFAYFVETLINVGMWFLVFGSVYWGVTCFMEIVTLKKAYWKERTLTARIYRWSKNGNEQYGDKVRHGASDAAGLFQKVWNGFRGMLNKIYDEFLHADLSEKSNKMIVKALIINFVLLVIITCFWFYGIFALIIYSVVLWLILRKYSQDLKKKYGLLLESTNLLAEGNLDAPIEGDMGIFNPVKEEIQKIQKGFKKAVQEEVKSERMKTELITNVSHDLKTPLTAIITYVDLLKAEDDPEKRKEYLEVLEKKSLRLKVLIEDLFEISKATSKNVTMNFMNVDIVGLLKQVGLECDSKIKASNLDFRWNLPEGKVVMLLDSQKTYRIFENLIVNITKYGMPHTRVYVDFKDEGSHVSISMKNVSATELNFNSDEITDRFVRGDSSRNTEGSGLGLAIAKSFTELQFGTLKVSTDADLFKVVIRFPKRTENEEMKTEG